jgi:hypothetical protein
MLASKVHRSNDIRHMGALSDKKRTLVDHRIEDCARLFVAIIAGGDHRAAQALPELLNRNTSQPSLLTSHGL